MIQQTLNKVARLVLGVPRSGTSAISQMLNDVGVNFGDPAHFLDPQQHPHNPNFFELQWCNDLNSRLIQAMGGIYAADFLPSDNDFQLAGVDPFREEIRRSIVEEFGDSPSIGIKDPRFCFTFPIWQDELQRLGYQIQVLLAIRNEAACHASNTAVEPKWADAKRWQRFYLQSLLGAWYFTRDTHRTVIDFDKLIVDPLGYLRAHHQSLDIDLDQCVAAVSRLNPGLIHQQPANAGDNAWIVDLSNRVLNGTLATDYYLQFREIQLLDGPREPDPMIAQLHQQVAAAQQQVAIAEQQVGQSLSQVESLHASIKFLQEQRGAELLQKEAMAETLRLDIERLQQQIAAMEQLREQTERALLTQTQTTQEVVQNLEVVRREHAQLHEAHAAMGEELRAYRLQRSILLGVMEKLYQTRSWRWTMPLRAGVHLLHHSIVITREAMIPMSPLETIGPYHWRCLESPRLVGWCLPAKGWVRINLKLTTNVATRASLYFDTGRFFNAEQRIDLGVVDGVTRIDQLYFLADPAYSFRLDPLQGAGEFQIEHFEIRRLYGNRRQPDN